MVVSILPIGHQYELPSHEDATLLDCSSSLVNSKDININEYFKDSIKLKDGDYIEVCVEDEGIGIAQKDLLRAFDKFAQIENSLSRKAGGSGLGLPIAKQLLEAHNGAIWCDSEPEKGSRFYFALPVSQIPADEKILISN